MTLKTPRISQHIWVADVFFKGGGQREVHCDVIKSIPHGFNFCRGDGTFDFYSANVVECIEMNKAVEMTGMKQ